MKATILPWLKCIPLLPILFSLNGCTGREVGADPGSSSAIPQTIIVPGNSNVAQPSSAPAPADSNATVAGTKTAAPAPGSPPPTPSTNHSTASAVATAAPAPSLSNTNSAPLPPAIPVEPASIQPLVKDLAQLAKAGVAESVITAFLQESQPPARLSTEEIVYLTDLGLPPAILASLIGKKDGPTNAVPDSATPSTPANVNAPPPAPPPGTVTNVITPTYVQQPAPSPSTPVVVQQPVVIQQPVVVPQQPTTVAYFYDSLSPYGSWVDVDGYGRCWAPSLVTLGADWRPYGHGGRWIWTDYGWYWYSDYPWGWATFHYGRWHYHARHRWVWIPDLEWGPAWVCWRRTPTHCGWAPLPPGAHFRGSGWSFHFDTVGADFGFGLAYSSFSFVHWSRFCDPRPYHHFTTRSHSESLYRNSTVVNNTIVGNNNTIIFEGAGRQAVQSATRTPIPQATLRETAYQTASASVRERMDNAGNGGPLVVNSPRIPSAPPARPGSAAGSGKWAPATAGPTSASSLSGARDTAYGSSKGISSSPAAVGVSSPFIPSTRGSSSGNVPVSTASPAPSTSVRSTPGSAGSISPAAPASGPGGAVGGRYTPSQPSRATTPTTAGPSPASPATPRATSPFQPSPSLGRPQGPTPTVPAQPQPSPFTSPVRREAGSAFQPGATASAVSGNNLAPRSSTPSPSSTPVPYWMRESGGSSASSLRGSSLPNSVPTPPASPSGSAFPNTRSIAPTVPSPQPSVGTAFRSAVPPSSSVSPAFTPRTIPSPSQGIPRSDMGSSPRGFTPSAPSAPSPGFAPSRPATSISPSPAPAAPRNIAPSSPPSAPASRHPASRRSDP